MAKSTKDWIKEIEEQHARPLGVDDKEFLELLSKLFEKLDWRDELTFKDVGKIRSNQTLERRGSDSISDWESKPEDVYSLWPYVATAMLDCDLPLPDCFANDPRIDALYEKRQARELQKQARIWRNRLGNLSQAHQPTEDPLIAVRLKLAGLSFRWESCFVAEGEWEATDAKTLIRWLEKEYGFLDRFHASSQILCSLFREYYSFTQRVRLDLDRPVDCSFINKLLHHPDTRNSIVGTDANTLTWSGKNLVWSGIKEGPTQSGEYRVRLEQEDGSPAPESLRYLPGPPPLYLSGNQLYSGPPMLIADAQPNRSFKIPATALESPEGLLFLRKQELPLPEKLEGKVVAIPLDTRLYCSLRSPAENEGRELEIHLFSVSKDLGHWFTLTADGWQTCPNFETEALAAEIGEGTFFDFPESLTVLDRLADFDLDEEDTGVWMRELESGFPQAFSDWIQSLPTDIQIIADDELDSLVDSHPSGRYTLNIQPSQKPDWFNIRLEPEIIDSVLTEEEADLLLEAKGKFVHLPGKGWRRFEATIDSEQQAILDTLGLSFQDAENAIQTAHALQLSEVELHKRRHAELSKAIKRSVKALKKPKPVQIPKGMKTELRPYQIEGFKFLAYLSQNNFGGVLADDMGLGKTLQCLTWLTWLKHRQPEDEPFQCLVVCPKSVMHVWRDEVARHSHLLEIALYDSNTVNKTIWQSAGIDILVANYSQLRIRRDFFESIDWTVSVLDEGQYIKNPQSQTAKSALALNATHRLVLTGTPIENKTLDLWSLFAYSMPGLLSSQTVFKRQYRDTDPLSSERISRRVRHFMMRRSKKQVAPDLPERIEETITCQLEEEQQALYKAELKVAQQHLQDSVDDNGGKKRFHILASLLRLRQICCHPQLVNPAYTGMKSAKLEALKEHVSSLMEEGHKVLIFSQFVEMLHIIKAELDTLGCKQLMLTGQTRNREEIVRQFQNDPEVDAFLLSLKAAGSGLNLTASSYVILYDPWWNPAVEAQAIDRAHRIGQKNTVNAYRLICSGSVEEKIQSLQLKKEELANDIVREDSLNQILNFESLKTILSGD